MDMKVKYNSPFSMLIILPKNTDDQRASGQYKDKLASNGSDWSGPLAEPVPMSHSDIKTLLSLMSLKNIEIHLPKFEYEDSHSLIEPLVEAGYTYINDNTYDRLLENQVPVNITQIIQKTKIRVDEEGTEASSTTKVEMNV